jgi:hypothetical protein
MRDYIEILREVAGGELTAQEAAKKTPVLKRATEVCPCSKSVRWVEEAAAPANGGNGS